MSKDPDDPPEPAPGEKKRRYWLATHTKAKRKGHPPPAPGEPQRVHIVSGHNYLVKAKEEPQEPNYTGRYESPWPETEAITSL